MNLLTIQQIMGSNWEFLTSTLDNEFVVFDSIINNLPYLTKYKSYLLNRLKSVLKPYLNLESLYDLETSQNLIYGYISEFLPYYINKVMDEKLMLDAHWDNFDNLGQISSVGENTQGYSGYDVDNQEGQFIKSSASSKQGGGSQRMQYLVYLNEHTNNWVNDFIKNVIKKIIRIVY